MSKTVDVQFRQSEANDPDQQHILEALLSRLDVVPDKVTCRRLTGGYSGARLYLARPIIGGHEGRHWVLKVDTLANISAELNGTKIASNFVALHNRINVIGQSSVDGVGVIVMDYASFTGHPPRTLEDALKTAQALDATKSVLKLITSWNKAPSFERTNVAGWINTWSRAKVELLTDEWPDLKEPEHLYAPDFREACANPAYWITRGLKSIECKVPMGFTHGDLNLRNILFDRDTTKQLRTDTPLVIDYRHSGTEQSLLVDLAKLESCIRLQRLPEPRSVKDLEEVIAFLDASSRQMTLSGCPQIVEDKALQEAWSLIREIRQAVSNLVTQCDGERGYWSVLASYSVSIATYKNIPLQVRRLALIDAGRILTQHLLTDDRRGKQFVFPVHAEFSPAVGAEQPSDKSSTYTALLSSQISQGGTVLVIGDEISRRAGIGHTLGVVQSIYGELTGANVPPVNWTLLLQSLANKFPRQSIAKTLRARCSQPQETDDLRLMRNYPWRAIVYLGFDGSVYESLLKSPLTGGALRYIRSDDDLANCQDDISRGAVPYLPLYGDIESSPNDLMLTVNDKHSRLSLLRRMLSSLYSHTRAISVLFWKCGLLPLENFAEVHSSILSANLGNVDCFVLVEGQDANRDGVMEDLGFRRIIGRLADLPKGLDQVKRNAAIGAVTWSNGEVAYSLPDIAKESRGLFRMFELNGGLSVIDKDVAGCIGFLTGHPLTIGDIEGGCFIDRWLVRNEVLPRIRQLLSQRGRGPRPMFIKGRAGSGISTIMSLAAYLMMQERSCIPVASIRGGGRRIIELGEGGRLLAEVCSITQVPILLFLDANEWTGRELSQLVDSIDQYRGDVVVVIGGRTGTVDAIEREVECSGPSITVNDKLSSGEWTMLARLVKAHGFAPNLEPDGLARRMKAVGRLLPAIYEATDHKHRRFKEIIAWDYHRFDDDRLVQRALRLICAAGAFGIHLSQYWLLKALGGEAVTEAKRILERIEDDIVKYGDDDSSGDLKLAPQHRVIAEELVRIATPDADHRLADLRTIIDASNLSSRSEGMVVAHFLKRRGELIEWVCEAFAVTHSKVVFKVRNLYEDLLARSMDPDVEVMIRHQFGLLLRDAKSWDEALQVVLKAREIQPHNEATIHILGLIYALRADVTWKDWARTQDETSLREAREAEIDALGFFRETRLIQPYNEHGYESEARYYRRKWDAVATVDDKTPIKEETRSQLFDGIFLLELARRKIPRAKLKEIPETNSKLLSAIGRRETALELLRDEVRSESDPVRLSRLRRAIAVLAAEMRKWDVCERYCRRLIDDGEKIPGISLLLDDALSEQQRSLSDRIHLFRESALEWNTNDIKTQLRWAELCAVRGEWAEAERALRRAQQEATVHVSSFARNQGFGRLRSEGRKQGTVLEFQGQVTRLPRPYMGMVSNPKNERGFVFYLPNTLEGKVQIGSLLQYKIETRLSGFTAVDVGLIKA